MYIDAVIEFGESAGDLRRYPNVAEMAVTYPKQTSSNHEANIRSTDGKGKKYR
jgi:hypothetical protein